MVTDLREGGGGERRRKGGRREGKLQGLCEVFIHIYILVILFRCLETIDGVLACLLSLEVS